MYHHLFTVANLLACSVGIALAIFPTNVRPVAVVFTLFLALCWLVYWRFRISRRAMWALIALVCGFLRGLSVTDIAAAALLPAALDDQLFVVEGQITGLPRDIESYQRHGQQFDVDVSSSHCIDNCAAPDLQLLRVRWYGGERVKAGERWQFSAQLRRPRGLANPAGRDYEVWLVQQGISATAKITAGKRLAGAHGLLVWRETITLLLQQQLQHYSQRGILQALINGNNAAIDKSQWDIFSATNTTHLFVISGLHLSLMGGLCWWLCRRLFLLGGMRSPLWAAAGAALLAWIFAAFYAFLAGWAIPVQRALAVFTLLLMVFLLRRSIQPLHTFLLLLTLCLLIDPLVLLSMSFWLSWSAAAVLLLALTGRKRQSAWRLWWRSQWAITLGLAPVMLAALGKSSLLGLFANTLAIPLVNLLIVPLNLLALLLYFVFPVAAHGLWHTLNVLLDYLLQFLHWLVEWGGDLIWYPPFSWPTFLLLSVAVLLLLLPKALPGRPLALLCLLPLLFASPARVPDDELHLTVFDVGQGLAVLIRVADKVLLYDTGPKLGETTDAGDAVILPYLHQQGIRHIDYLVVSHADMDHAGGVSSLLKTISVGQLLGGEYLQGEYWSAEPLSHNAKINVSICQSRQNWHWQQFGFEFIHSSVDNGFSPLNQSGNNSSCVLRIYQRAKQKVTPELPALALLPGDIERSVEYRLLRDQLAALRSELLLMPHHGSRTSSSVAFVKAVAPGLAIASSGYRHRFGHPHGDIVQRYRQQQAELLNTADSGAISLVWRGGQWQIDNLARHNRAYFWQSDSFGD